MSKLEWKRRYSIAFPASPPFWRGVCSCGYMTIPHDDEPAEDEKQLPCPECERKQAETA